MKLTQLPYNLQEYFPLFGNYFTNMRRKNPNAGIKFRKDGNVLQREATALLLAEKEILAYHWLDFFFNAGLHFENTDGVV